MNCKKAEKKFSGYLENELDFKTRQQLEKHLEQCKHCTYEWRAFQNTLRIVKDMPAITPSADFDWQLRLRLAVEHSNRVSFREQLFGYLKSNPVFAFSGVLAILVMLSVGLYFYLSPSGISTNNDLVLHYVMPEISLNESIEQWSDFNPEAEKQLSELDLPDLRDVAQPFHKTVNTNYVLRTVSLTSDNVNNHF
jgi:hypothetical protein